MKFSIFQVSRRGGRKLNQDRMGYCYTRDSGLFVLADGMGGHPEGEVAAQIALQTLSALYQQEAKPIVKDVPRFLSGALMAAHHRIISYASEKGMLDTPRTTLVAAVIQAGQLSWIHCGDSRLYVVRGGQLLTRTRDHSYLEYPTPGVRHLKPVARHVLISCLGSPGKPLYDLCEPMALREGDRVALCSDGLWGNVADGDITQQLSTRLPTDAVQELVEMALRSGGEHCDNVTMLALQWEEEANRASSRSISTDSISDGVFASTIQSGVLDGLVDDMDSVEIERSIAEINAAIRRSTLKKP